MPTVVYTLREEIERHGGREVMRKLDGRTTGFPDGSTIVRDPQGYEVFRAAPPLGTRENMLARRAYHSIYVQAGEQDFQSLKAAILGTGFVKFSDETAKRYGGARAGMSEEAAIEILRNIKNIVNVERAAVARIDLEISRLPEEIKKQEQKQVREKIDRQMESKEARQREKVLLAVAGINLTDESNPTFEEYEDGNLDLE